MNIRIQQQGFVNKYLAANTDQGFPFTNNND